MPKIRKNLGSFLKRHKSVIVRRTILTLLIFAIAWITILKIEKIADIILETGPLKDAYTAVFTPLVEPSRRDSSHSTSQPPSQDQSAPLSVDDGSEKAPSASLKDGSAEKVKEEITLTDNPAAKIVPPNVKVEEASADVEKQSSQILVNEAGQEKPTLSSDNFSFPAWEDCNKNSLAFFGRWPLNLQISLLGTKNTVLKGLTVSHVCEDRGGYTTIKQIEGSFKDGEGLSLVIREKDPSLIQGLKSSEVRDPSTIDSLKLKFLGQKWSQFTEKMTLTEFKVYQFAHPLMEKYLLLDVEMENKREGQWNNNLIFDKVKNVLLKLSDAPCSRFGPVMVYSGQIYFSGYEGSCMSDDGIGGIFKFDGVNVLLEPTGGGEPDF